MPFTMTVPTTLNGARGEAEVTGQIYILQIGDRYIKFLCHMPVNGYRHDERDLTHVDSRMRVGCLDPVGVSHFIATGKRLTLRGKAELLIQNLINSYGADKLLAKLDEATEKQKAASASQQ